TQSHLGSHVVCAQGSHPYGSLTRRRVAMTHEHHNLSGVRKQPHNKVRLAAPGSRFSIVAMQEELMYPDRQGGVVARRVKLLRVDGPEAAPVTLPSSRDLPLPEPPIPQQLPQSVVPPRPEAYKRVFEEPGVTVTVTFSQFQNEIAPQLRHPERLPDE